MFSIQTYCTYFSALRLDSTSAIGITGFYFDHWVPNDKGRIAPGMAISEP